MIGLFVLGGVCGATGASAALVMGASLPKAVLIYMGVGMILPVSGIISMAFRNEDTDLVPAGATDSFSNTMSQWNADPESHANSQKFGLSHDEDDDQQDKVA
ncbi:MAG: hypothetical protein ABJN14_06830 [Paracoccaceae bacterium]